MEKRRTLYERLTGANKAVANEDTVNNPFKARIGNTFHLDILDYRNFFYKLQSINVFDRGTSVPLTDYKLEATVYGTSDKKSLTLRTVPRDGKEGASKLDFRVLILTSFFECARDDDSQKGIMEGVNDPAGEFVINPGTAEEKKYWRMQGLKEAENVVITTLTDDDPDHNSTMRIELWGFSRTTTDEAKQEVNEYLYVQKDSKSGWLEILIGTEISPERIIV